AVREEPDLCIVFPRLAGPRLVNRVVITSDRRVAAWGALRANWIYLKVGARWGSAFAKGWSGTTPTCAEPSASLYEAEAYPTWTMRAAMMMREVSMTDVEAIVQGYYGDRPVLQPIEDALRAAGVDPETPSHRDLWPFDQLHSRGIVATREHAERARIRAGMYVLEIGCGLGGASRYLV